MAIAGRVAIVPKGDWSADATYKRLDAVKYNNGLFIAKKEVSVGILPTNIEYWMKALDGSQKIQNATKTQDGLMSKEDKTKLDDFKQYKPDGETITADEDGTLHGVAKVTVDTALSSTSTNPVQNKVVDAAIVKKADTISYDKITSTLYLKSGSTVLSSAEIKSAVPTLKIVTFANGTDEEISAMIQAHYNDKINIADYWAVGDTRSVSLSAMSATGVGESHRAQTVQLVILDFEHDDLATAINGHSKAAVSIGLKDCLMDASNASNPVNGGGNTENGYMNSSATNAGGWKNCARRAWCNNVFFAALPSTWQSMVKTVNKKSGTGGGSSSGTETTADKIFLASEIEIFGSKTHSVDGEGTQYQYYKNATANKYKMPKWSSGNVSNIYWERSPFSGNTYYFCYMNYGGAAEFNSADFARGVAPCLCI